VRAVQAALGTLRERRCITRDRQRPQQERVEHEFGIAHSAGQSPEGADEQEVLLGGRLMLLDHQPVDGLQQDGPGGVAGVVVDDPLAVRRDRHRLRDHVQAAAGRELQVDVAERFQPSPEP
jgi:hypothetical protein